MIRGIPIAAFPTAELRARATIAEKGPRVVCNALLNSQKMSGGKRFEILVGLADTASGDGTSSTESM
ncbi:MAG: hypothetical protein EAZ60_03150 [Oscillatoriales cyanobacterium]|nr:MAG: hypothetical protein EAZ60_03150 [Oscillatoriales cyanobacterium]